MNQSDIFGIRICTYYRKNNSTFEYIKKCINSIKNQTFKNWKVFLIGDGYENIEEFKTICDLLPTDKLTFLNLQKGYEREIIKLTGEDLWCCGGVNAANVSLDLMTQEKITFYSCLDDDDEWLPNHLETHIKYYNLFPESSFIYTKSYYLNRILPFENSIPIQYNNLPPRHGNIVHSTMSWKLNNFNLRYRNVLEQKRRYPSDADMWERMMAFSIYKNYKFLHIPEITVKKDSERNILQQKL